MGQQLLNLIEDEGVEFVGVDSPLWATAFFAAGTEGVTVGAGVVARQPVVAIGPVGAEFDTAMAAANKPSEQERVGLGSPGAEDGVVVGGSLDSLEGDQFRFDFERAFCDGYSPWQAIQEALGLSAYGAGDLPAAPVAS